MNTLYWFNRRKLETGASLIFIIAIVLVMQVAPAQAFNGPIAVTIQVNDSLSSPISGVAISYLDGYWKGLGNTNGSGQVSASLPGGSWQFRAEYGGTTALQTQDISTNSTVTFYTSKASVAVKTSGGSALDGVAVSYLAGYWRGIGNTVGGAASAERFPGTYEFKADYGGTVASQNMILAGNGKTAGQSSTITFYTSKAMVEVKTSGGSALDGVAVSYLSGYWRGIGSTAAGVASAERFPGTYEFKADYGGTVASQNMNLAGDGLTLAQGSTITFYTSEVKVEAKGCDSTPVPGVAISYLSGYYRGIGSTSAGGLVSAERFPGTFTFKADYGGTTATKDAPILGNGISSGSTTTIVFNPTRVSLQYSGSKAYLSGYWRGFSGPIYMFPGTYTFRFDSLQQAITVSGCDFTQSVLAIRLKNSSGTGVAGGKAYLGVGGWPYIGDTDGSGNLVYLHNGVLGNMRIRMAAPNCGGSQDSPLQDTAVNSNFNFQTSQVVIQLKDSAGTLTNGGSVTAGCGGWPVIGATGANGLGTLYHEHFPGVFTYRMSFNGSTQEIQQDVSIPFIFQTTKAVIRLIDHLGNPLNGGKVLQGIGGWPQIGITGDGAAGEVWYELFPGTHKFRMTYNYGTDEKSQDISTPVVFQTALVKLQFSGTIQHKVGGWPAYAGPIEMLPVSHGFGFTGCGYPRQEVFFTPTAGTVFAKSMVFVSLKNSTGAGLAGGDFKYRFGWGPYTPIGTTGSSGLIVYGIDGLQTTTNFNVAYQGASMEKAQNIATNSCVVFTTVPVTAALFDSNSNNLSSGATFEWRYGWGSFTTWTAAVELLPVVTNMKVSYMGASVEKSQNVATNAHFLFNTVPVTAALFDSTNSNDLSSGATFDWRYGWGSFTTWTGPVELLPVATNMRVSYSGASVEKSQNVATNGYFLFNTVPVTAALFDSTNTVDLSSGATFDWRYGWGSFTTWTGPVELLPVATNMRVSYGGASVEKSQNVATNGYFLFNTGTVTSATCTQYRYGWGSYMTFTSPMQLLAVSTSFRDANGPDTSATPTSGGNISVVCP